MTNSIVLEYLRPTHESRERFRGEPQRLYFVQKQSGEVLPPDIPEDWKQGAIDKIEYLRQFGFSDEQEMIWLRDELAILSGHYVYPYFPGQQPEYRYSSAFGPGHARWLYICPVRHGFTSSFLVAMQWGDEFERYTGLPDPFETVYLYERDNAKDLEPYVPSPNSPYPDWDKDQLESREAGQWSRYGLPKSAICTRFGLLANASWQEICQAAKMPIIVARWNPVPPPNYSQLVPDIEQVLLPR